MYYVVWSSNFPAKNIYTQANFSWMVRGVINSLISPKFPHVPLRVGGWPLGYGEQRCWANCRAVSFQEFQPM